MKILTVFAALTFGLVGAGFYFDHVESPASASDVKSSPVSVGEHQQSEKLAEARQHSLNNDLDTIDADLAEIKQKSSVSPEYFAKAMTAQREAAAARLEEAMVAQRKAAADNLQVISKQTSLLYETMIKNAEAARTRAKASAERDAVLQQLVGENGKKVEATRDTTGEVHQNQRLEQTEKALEALNRTEAARQKATAKMRDNGAADAPAADEL